jgi:CRISPR/Cas system-associated exonuclease Cas4 (RecB family)
MYQRLRPLPITDEQSLYFIAGHGHHHIIEAVLGPKKDHTRTDSGEFIKHGIYFSPDLREEVLDYPIEIKTSRAMYAPDDNGKNPKVAFEGYLKQLCAYMALMDKKLGMLMVLYLARKVNKWQTKPAIRFYKVKMKPSERKAKVAELIGLAKKLTSAVKKKSPAGIPLCPAWLCRECPYFKECKPWKDDPKRKNIQEKK